MKQDTSSPVGKVFSIAALAEAITWAGLLLGMFIKYVLDGTALVSWWFGRLHGIAFLVYFVVALAAAFRLRWSLWHTVLAILAAIPPLVTLPLEIWYRKRGLLAKENDSRA